MKKASIIAMLGLSAAFAQADDWKQWNVVVSPVYSVAVSDLKFNDARQGGGVGVELFALKNLGVQVQGVTYDVHNSTVDEASAQLNYYVPVEKTPIALVASLGTLKGFEQNENWQYKVGGGAVAALNEHISVRVGGYLVDDFKKSTELRFEGAVGWLF
jgi:hypothetical protein